MSVKKHIEYDGSVWYTVNTSDLEGSDFTPNDGEFVLDMDTGIMYIQNDADDGCVPLFQFKYEEEVTT